MSGPHGVPPFGVVRTGWLRAIPLAVFFLCALLVLAAIPAFGQERRVAMAWPTDPLAVQYPDGERIALALGSASAAPGGLALPLTPPPTLGAGAPVPQHPETLPPAILLASMGSVAGLIVGARAGSSLRFDQWDGDDPGLVGAMFGGAAGSALGAWMASGIVQGRWGRAALGSLGGVLAGGVAGIASGSATGSAMVAVGIYGLTHGLVTAAAAGS